MKPATPFSVMWELTPDCNQRCTHCYGSFSPIKAQKGRANLETLQKVLGRLNDEEIMMYMISGGEPLSRRDMLFAVLESARQNNVVTTMNSNLTLLSHDDAVKLKELGLGSILTSLTSHDEAKHNQITGTPNSFQNFIRGIKLARREEIPLSVNMVVRKDNLDDILETGRFVKNLGILSFSSTPIQPTIDSHRSLMLSPGEIVKVCDQLDQLQSEGMNTNVLQPLVYCLFDNPQKYSRFLVRECYGGVSDFYITPEGNVGACGLIGKFVGNILDSSMKQLLERMEGFRTDEKGEKSNVPVECYDCVEVERCRGGCRAGAKALFGSEKSKNPYFRAPLKDKIDFTRKKQPFDFFNSDYGDISYVLGFTLGNVRFRKEPTGDYLLVTPRGMPFFANQSIAKVYSILSRTERMDKNELRKFSEENKLPFETLNKILNLMIR